MVKDYLLKTMSTCSMSYTTTPHTTTVLRPFFQDHLGEWVPEGNFWTSWCKGRLTEADTPTIQLGATPSGLTSAHLHHPPIFYRPDALPATLPTVSKHWRHQCSTPLTEKISYNTRDPFTVSHKNGPFKVLLQLCQMLIIFKILSLANSSVNLPYCDYQKSQHSSNSLPHYCVKHLTE